MFISAELFYDIIGYLIKYRDGIISDDDMIKLRDIATDLVNGINRELEDSFPSIASQE